MLSRLNAALKEFDAKRATELSMAHGNTGRSPSNMTPSNVVTSIMRIVHRYSYFRVPFCYMTVQLTVFILFRWLDCNRRFTCHNPEKGVLEVVGDDTKQSIAGLASAVESENPEVAEAVDKKTIENVIRRYLERHGLKALLVKLSAHNTSPFSEANSGELGILHEKIVRLQQRIEESKTAGSNEKDLAKLTASLEELRVTSSEIRSIQEHYTLVHYEVHAFICKLQGLAQVISNLDFVWSCFHTLKCFELSGVGRPVPSGG